MDEREPSGVDRSLIEACLRLTVEERLDQAIAWARMVEELRAAPVVRVGAV